MNCNVDCIPSEYVRNLFNSILNLVPPEIQQKCMVSLMPLISSINEVNKTGKTNECKVFELFKKNVDSIVLKSCKPYIFMIMVIFLIPLILYLCLFYYYKKTLENRESNCYNKKTFNFLKQVLIGQFVLIIVNCIVLLSGNIILVIPIIIQIINVIFNLVLFKFLMFDTMKCGSSHSKIKFVLQVINIISLINIVYSLYKLYNSNILKCMYK